MSPNGPYLIQILDAIVRLGDTEGDLRRIICRSRKPDLRASKEKNDVCRPAGTDLVDPTGRFKVEDFGSLWAFRTV